MSRWFVSPDFATRRINGQTILIPKRRTATNSGRHACFLKGLGADILDELASGIDEEAIVANLAARFPGQPPDEIQTDTRAFISGLLAHGVLIHPDHFGANGESTAPQVLPPLAEDSYQRFCTAVETSAARNRVPVWCTLELTYRCNLRCVHCYLGQPPSQDEMSRERIFRLLDEMCEAGCLWLILTGGEPMMRSDFLDIYQYARASGLIVFVFTNGTLLTDRILQGFMEAPPFSVDISLYGASREVYERTTGVAGSFERCRKGIEQLVESGVTVRLKTPLMTLNAAEIPEMESWAGSLGVEYTYNAKINPTLDRDLHPCGLRVAPEAVADLDHSIPGRRRIYETCPKRLHPFVPSPKRLLLCNAGLNSCCITPSGAMQTCVLYRTPEYDLESLPLARAWADLSARIGGLRPRGHYRCGTCEDLRYCTPCPGIADLEHGDQEAPIEYFCQIAEARRRRFSPPPGQPQAERGC